jgi:hypothetical protein
VPLANTSRVAHGGQAAQRADSAPVIEVQASAPLYPSGHSDASGGPASATPNRSSGVDRAYDFLTARRARLPSGLRQRLRGVPTGVLLSLALIPCFALGALVVALTAKPAGRASSTSSGSNVQLDVKAAEPSSPPSALPRRERAALTSSPAAEKSRVAAPNATSTDEAPVLLTLAESLAGQRRDADAVAVLDRLIARSADLRSDPRVAKLLLQTVYSDDRAASAGTFALLEGPMAEAGAALMYELALSRDVRDGPRRRAETWLKSKAFDRVSPLPLYTVVKLRYAKTCEEKRALLGLATAGGQQTLDYLRELEARTTCAPDDMDNCYPCLRTDSRLADTIAALAKRLGS